NEALLGKTLIVVARPYTPPSKQDVMWSRRASYSSSVPLARYSASPRGDQVFLRGNLGLPKLFHAVSDALVQVLQNTSFRKSTAPGAPAADSSLGRHCWRS